MPKKNAQVVENATEITPEISEATVSRRRPLWLRLVGGALVILILLVASFEFVYAGKILPGVSANGIYLGGLSRAEATKRLADQTEAFQGETLPVSYGNTTLRIPVRSLDLHYNNDRAVTLAADHGHQGGLGERLHAQLRALLNRPTAYQAYSYDDTRLTPYITEIANETSSPVADATLSFSSDHPSVTPAKPGHRLDLGRLTGLIQNSLATTSTEPVAAPVYALGPVVTTDALRSGLSQADRYTRGSIELTYADQTKTIDQGAIISWLKVTRPTTASFVGEHSLTRLNPIATPVTLTLDNNAVTAYVATLAGSIDQSPSNAALAMENGQLKVVQASKDGRKLDQADAIKAVTAALEKPAGDRQAALKVATAKAAVNEENLDELGIKEQLSQGETYFPGSPSTRLTNVRAGAAKFNGVLLAPGEVFSFGKLLGQVDASTGYVPELVILGDHEEKQYGGGLCQVSSTAFRAALNAGLPINERVNHSFAISYYTWPYNAPGVDATIYYPAVDFKFTNDTGHYILMQTTMKGTDLKFDFYGTKTKSGVIRDPQFITGDSDTTKPSHTVFYRDVLDLAGNVTKTDTFHTYYKSSKDFPITQQFN